MEKLIWFSIPGALVVFAFVVTYPQAISAHGVAALIAGTPVIGFLAHQGFRVLFELYRGFECRHRSVISQIADDFDLKGENRLRQAFEIWEVTFYGAKFPAGFRDHDRGAWHYILSFWSVALGAVLGLLLLPLLTCYFESTVRLRNPAVAFYAVTLVTFVIKGWQTFRSLVGQELVVYKAHFKQFKRVVDSCAHYKENDTDCADPS